jgi:tetratricopeptide (TPR) repeat protein
MQLFGRRKGAESHDPFEKQRKQAVEAQRSALLFLQGKLYGQAEAELRRAVTLDPDSATGHAYLGMVLHKLGRLQEATDELGIAINLMPEDEALWRTRGSFKEALNDMQGAILDYQMALQLDSTQSLTHAALGAILVEGNDLQRGEFHLKRALELEPRDAIALADLARLREQQGRSAEAIATFRGALAMLADRDNPPLTRIGGMPVPADSQPGLAARVQARLGLLLKTTSDLHGALIALQGAHEGLPDDPDILRELAHLHIQQGRLTEALALYERAEKQFPSNQLRYEADLNTLVAGQRSLDAERLSGPSQGVPRTIGADPGSAAASAGAGDSISRLEAQVRAEPSNRAARRDLSVAYLRAGRITEAKEQARIVEELRSQRTGGAEQAAT